MKKQQANSKAAKNVIKIAVIGAGEFGKEHLRAYLKNPRCEVVAVVDQSAELARSVAETNSISRFYSSIERLLMEDRIDAVSLVTPAGDHLQSTKQLLAADIPILLEKPIVLSYEDAQTLTSLVSRSQAFLMPGHVLRFSPAYSELKQRINSGEVGPPITMSFRRHRSRDHADRFADVHPAYMTAIHDIDLAMWLSGATGTLTQANEVALGDGAASPSVVWATAISMNGIHWSFQVSWSLSSGQEIPDQSEVFGRHGALRLAVGTGLASSGLTEKGSVTADRDDLVHALDLEIDHFLDCVERGQPSSVIPLEEAVEGIRLAAHIQRRCAEGRDES